MTRSKKRDSDALSPVQERQDDLYAFPYHYIPKLTRFRFSQTVTLFWGYEYISYVTFVLDIIRQIPFTTLLDVGCGDGRFTGELHAIFPDRHVVGLDFSRRAIGLARSMNPEIDFVRADITEEGTFEEPFDIITMIETLEHISPSSIDRFLGAVHRHLTSKGILVLTVPSTNTKVQAKHYQHFDFNLLEKTLSGLFSIERCYYINKISWLASNFLEKCMINRFFILNERHLMNLIYGIYMKYCFHAKKHNAKRIVLVCRKS